jgi:hypothetical protein
MKYHIQELIAGDEVIRGTFDTFDAAQDAFVRIAPHLNDHTTLSITNAHGFLFLYNPDIEDFDYTAMGRRLVLG